jgi:hypothetical protein
MSPGDTITNALKLAFKWNCHLLVVESNAYQFSLLYWFTFICQQRGIEGIAIRDIYSGSVNKASRILAMFKQLVSPGDKPPEIGLHPNVRALVFTQIMQYNPLRRDNVDGILDLLTYAPRVIELYPLRLWHQIL